MGDNRIVFAARPYYDEDDGRHIAARVAAMLVNNPGGSVLEQHLAAAGIPATSAISTIDSVGARNVMVIEYRLNTACAPAQIVERTRAAIAGVGRMSFSDRDLARAKACAQSLLDISVSGLPQFVDAVCGFVARYGRPDVIDDYRRLIDAVDRDAVAAVLAELYAGEAFVVDQVRAA
ncbi:hypothetical protein [Rhodococcus zopfii]|uniref:hypothetical protein n=1 Tax=Rhodococcus zopfii TaxID=43772 RepID=UPI003529292E